MNPSKSRIWELDALRGVCILCVIVVHFLFDLSFFGGVQLTLPAWFSFVQNYGGVIFVVLSGLCATLGSRSFRRGVIVFAAGMLITIVTIAMHCLGMAGREVVVWFGVLHLLGVCMMLFPFFRKLKTFQLLSIGVTLICIGYLLSGTMVSVRFLFPLGFVYEGFVSSDYFPLLPHLGWFLLGAGLGRMLYADKKTRLPGSFSSTVPARFFCWCGRQSLFIYLLHQPVLYGLLELILLLQK